MALDIKKFLGRFTGEARDHLARLETGLAALSAGDSLDAETINGLFRAAHTIKGSSRMLKLNSIAEIAHQLEEVLGALRDGKLPLPQPPEFSSLLLRGVDAISALVEQVEPSGGQLPPPDPALLAALAQAATGAEPSESAESADPAGDAGRNPDAAKPPEPATDTPPPSPASTPAAAPAATEAPTSVRAPETVRVRMEKLDELIKLMGEVVSSQTRFHQQLLETRALDAAFQALLKNDANDTNDRPGVDMERLAEHTAALHRATLNLRDLVMEQELLTDDLNDRALIMRMLPLAIVFDPIARVARELGRELGREVHCEISGGEIELDRHLIDRLNDVLVHLLRNAIDHGLEPPQERQAAGKPSLGRIRLSARQEGVGVLIEISDDGRGLDRDKILAKAVQKGLIEPTRTTAINDDQVADLIFQPGFSTSAIITEVSGRGVGMDVVKRTIVDDLQGAVSVSSRPGEGTHMRIQLPLSLAVMRILLFEAAGKAFGLTAQHVAELIRVPKGDTIQVADRPAIVLRNEFLPLIPLAELLRLQAPSGDVGAVEPSLRPAGGEAYLVVVINVHQSKLGLVVDRLIDEHDMVIKPLPEHMRGLGMVAGMVITGTNALVSVLQAPALLAAARRIRGEALITSDKTGAAGKDAGSQDADGHDILVVDDSLNTREIEKEILEAHGYRVTLAEDGLDGWQKALGGHFDAVLTDVDMPGMDGFSLTARLRENDRYRTTPIAIITSRQKEEDKQRGIQVGADAYIVKGDFNQSSLVETLKNLLG
ncbi:hybrid sensor histidine kinase/response regulator [Rhabdochromatium marinum]|uniref:hybrid sensor histidine kinase/response regulator n=1 Tax=Rhabdochromatium marinum TaxID=48729 RepID=UPI001906843A|nr:hybrid sensor histidine kinase/response regulator [Rhabdochromatium marinum]MBK1648827.1 hybrid sensor histidine kinase/response regulator [Rhabdochromatium marinum]